MFNIRLACWATPGGGFADVLNTDLGQAKAQAGAVAELLAHDVGVWRRGGAADPGQAVTTHAASRVAVAERSPDPRLSVEEQRQMAMAMVMDIIVNKMKVR